MTSPSPNDDPRSDLAQGNRSEIVLVVEDDALVRSVAVESLHALGYTVLEADSARAALATIRGGQEVSLLLTDVVMPDMTGRQLADAVKSLKPSIKVLYTTGFGQTAVVHNLIDQSSHCLPKPYSVERMAQVVRAILDGA